MGGLLTLYVLLLSACVALRFVFFFFLAHLLQGPIPSHPCTLLGLASLSLIFFVADCIVHSSLALFASSALCGVCAVLSFLE